MKSVSVDTSSVERVARRIDRLPREWTGKRVEIRCSATTERSADENREIFVRQADEGRDPLFLGTAEHNKASSMLAKEVAKEIEGETIRARSTMEAIGKLFVGWIKAHVKAGRSRVGGMAPLAESTREYKAKHYPGKPILERTGQLLRSLYHEVIDG